MSGLTEKEQRLVDEVVDSIFYHQSDYTQREKLRVCFRMLAEVLIGDREDRPSAE